MIRGLLLVLLTLSLMAVPAFAADGSSTHSGRVLEIKDGGRTIVLEEMGPWYGPHKPGIVRRTIQLTPGAAVRLVRATGEWDSATRGYESMPVDLATLKPGDFVNISTDASARVSQGLEVMRPDDSALASPKLEPSK